MEDVFNLNPCPICGSEPVWLKYGGYFQIECYNKLKGECTNVKTFTYLTEGSCIKDWENRAGKKKDIHDILKIYEELTI